MGSEQQNGRVQAFWPNGSFSYAVASLGHDDHQLWYTHVCDARVCVCFPVSLLRVLENTAYMYACHVCVYAMCVRMLPCLSLACVLVFLGVSWRGPSIFPCTYVWIDVSSMHSLSLSLSTLHSLTLSFYTALAYSLFLYSTGLLSLFLSRFLAVPQVPNGTSSQPQEPHYCCRLRYVRMSLRLVVLIFPS